VETLNITTIRAGVALKMGQGRRIISKEEVVEVIDPEVEFSTYINSNLFGVPSLGVNVKIGLLSSPSTAFI
jgi:hypothetical protein